MKLPVIQLVILTICFLLPCLLHAQPGFGDDVDDVPIDGGLSLLIAAGVGYSSKKIMSRKTRKQD